MAADSDEQAATVITPQVKPAGVTADVHLVDEAAEKKRRIDEALERYDMQAHTVGAMVAPASVAPSEQPKTPISVEVPEQHWAQKPQAKSEQQYIMEHAAEALALLKPRRDGPMPSESIQHTVTPTKVDPEASIAAAAAYADEQKRVAAAQEADQTSKQKRYATVSDNPLQSIDKKDAIKFLILLACWILAVPGAIVLTRVDVMIWNDDTPVLISALFTTVEYLLGLYGALGWIPVVLFYIRKHKG